ncbi:LuxR C-terminal-related transcriptional regulator [uncultured Aquimarina sp.]|uniref:helix-turn-helix and ligand-binding sensor domain-containing protein n=1 Tax=uncultured Aquimarina sp. TaxID=575652 RepID=UPI00262393D8|nr:LuxR C-terminal-related transcriptional regulator [uncultured Aquimarina sp.]
MNRICFLFFLFQFFSFSQSIENKILPEIIHYDTKDMGFGAQSWDIGQDENGIVYVANENKVLIFDGSEWNSVATNKAMVNRSLFVKNKDSIYFGADGHFGLIINNDKDAYKVSLLNNVNKSISDSAEEYWRIHEIDDEVVFQTFSNLYINQGNIITKIPAPCCFRWSYKIDGDLYVNDYEYGIFKLSGTSLLPIYNSDELNASIIGVTKVGEDLILISDIKGLFSLNNNKVVPLDFSLSEEVKKAQIFSFLKLEDGRIALGTVSNGLYILDLDNGKTENINKLKGLQNNTVLSIFQDDEHNLWLALDYGVDYLKLNSSLKYFYDYYGKLGTTYAAIKDKGFYYIGTNQGLYLLDGESAVQEEDFEQLLKGQVWNIVSINDEILVGHDTGAYTLSEKTISKMGFSKGAWDFRSFKYKNKDLILSPHYNGVSLYEKIDNDWKEYQLKGFNKSVRYLEIDQDNYIWLALRSEGVFKFGLDDSNNTLIKEAFFPLSDFEGAVLSMSKVRKQIVITSDFYSYTYEPENNSFVKKELGKKKGYAPRIIEKGDEIWYVDNKSIVIENEKGLMNLEELQDQLVPDVLNSFTLDDTHELIPVYGGFSVYVRDNLTPIDSAREEVLIRDFVSVNSNVSYLEKSEIPFRDNDLKIRYALPIYGKKVSYQSKINDEDWNDWTTSTEHTLYNLTEGDYTFYIRAKYDETVRESSFFFIVKPPLYRTPWAYGLYLLLISGIVFVAFSINRYKMKKQKIKLLKQKEEKLSKQEEEYKAQQLEQERKIIELKNSKLEDEIKAKSRELTQIAYVNLNKNKILKKIRDKIVKIQESPNIRSKDSNYMDLKRLVEYYITDKESKLFKINFDKSHQEFYERLSKQHPGLTSKDLRLCAYLKMNLSSKEIAPLLGISPQSVDVNRHKLRKKLNLSSDNNLTQFLVSF